jgi:hypothetical protein
VAWCPPCSFVLLVATSLLCRLPCPGFLLSLFSLLSSFHKTPFALPGLNLGPLRLAVVSVFSPLLLRASAFRLLDFTLLPALWSPLLPNFCAVGLSPFLLLFSSGCFGSLLLLYSFLFFLSLCRFLFFPSRSPASRVCVRLRFLSSRLLFALFVVSHLLCLS